MSFFSSFKIYLYISFFIPLYENEIMLSCSLMVLFFSIYPVPLILCSSVQIIFFSVDRRNNEV